MTNRISGYPGTAPVATAKSSSGGAQAVDKAPTDAVAGTSAATSTADTVKLTGSARALQRLSTAVSEAPVVNTHKVAAVKAAVQNGTYQVDASRVADKLLQYENGLK